MKALDEIEAILRKCVILQKDEDYWALTLWIAFAWAISEMDFSPRVVLYSPEKRCGKSLALEVISLLLHEPRMTSSISASALFRSIDKDESKANLIDEIDATFGRNGDKEKAEALRQIINAGTKRGAIATRCVGATFETKDFKVFCAIAMAGIGEDSIPDTIRDRSIIIEMRRKHKAEKILEFQSDEVDQIFKPVRDRLEEWIGVHKQEFRKTRPELPSELNSRKKDVWKPLFKIAHSAGEEWIKKAWQASIALSSGEVEDDQQSYRLRLLSDCREIFKGRTSIGSTDMVAELRAIEEAPYGFGDHLLNTASLARNLSHYKIKPERNNMFRFYSKSSFEDAWTRYLDPLETVTPVKPVTVIESKVQGEIHW